MSAKKVERAKSLIYEVDADDRITFVGTAWKSFARQNDALPFARKSVIGTPIWQYLAGPELRHIYDLLFKKVRSRQTGIAVPFRCDSPTSRRYMELRISPLENEHLSINSVLLREEARQRVDFGVSAECESDEFLPMCSWCKRIRLKDESWVEIEDAVARLDVFDSAQLPGLTHGICPECAAVMQRKLLRT